MGMEPNTGATPHVLRLFREAAHLTQEELAERAAVSVRTISNLERGVAQRAHLDTVRRLTAALGLTTEQSALLFEAVCFRHTVRGTVRAEDQGRDGAPPLHTPDLPRTAPMVATTTSHVPQAAQAQVRGAQRFPLPVPITRLLGRERDIMKITELLRQRSTRLLTITGPGGVGKTHLALQVASQLAWHADASAAGPVFADGIAFVSLAALQDPTLLMAAIAQALDLREGTAHAFDTLVETYLRDRALLLLLDNCEHLLPAIAPRLAHLLECAAELTLLTTSRVALHLRGEQVYPLHPLPLPAEHESSLTAIEQSPAVQLFVERAGALDLSAPFALSPTNAGVVAAICQRVDGLPLAIELAAARTAHFSPLLLLERLEQSMPLLTDGPHDLPERQQTLRATVRWSHDLLPPTAQQLFRHLSVFAGGWTLDAAYQVWGGDVRGRTGGRKSGMRSAGHGGGGRACRDADAWEAWEASEASEGPRSPLASAAEVLALLVDYHLIQRVRQDADPRNLDDSGEAAGSEPRFTMFETVRGCAWELLQEAAEDEGAIQRHSTYYVTLAETAERNLSGPEQLRWSTRLKQEVPNLRAALRRSLDRQQFVVALRTSTALARFWLGRGYLSEGRAWLERALTLTADLTADLRTVCGQGIALAPTSEPSSAASERGGMRAMRGLMESVERAADGSPPEWLAYYARALARRALLAAMQSDFAVALHDYETSLELMRFLEDPVGIAQVLNNLGDCVRMQGDHRRALQLYQESLDLKLATGDELGISNSLNNLGLVQLELGDLEAAEQTLLSCLERTRPLNDRARTARALANLGYAANVSHRYVDAHRYLQESVLLWRTLDDPVGLAYALGNQGDTFYSVGAYEQALLRLREATGLYQQANVPIDMANGLEHIAYVWCAQSQYLFAVRLVAAASVIRGAMGLQRSPADEEQCAAWLSRARAALGDVPYQQAWDEGRGLSLDEAIAAALADPQG